MKMVENNDIDINIENIDVKEIMLMIKENIKKRGYNEEKIINEFNFNVQNYTKKFINLKNINLEIPITSRGKTSKIKKILKKIIRKIVRPYIRPILEEQFNFNSEVSRVLELLERKIESNQLEIKKNQGELLDIRKIEKEESSERIKINLKKILYYLEEKDNLLDLNCEDGKILNELILLGKKRLLGMTTSKNKLLKCDIKKLPIQYYDGFKYLNENDNLSLNGIFSSKIFKNIKITEIIDFIYSSYKNLNSDGILLFEIEISNNSENSHNITPFLLEKLLIECGFINIKIINSLEQKHTHIINDYEKIKRMYEIIYENQNYLIVAWKG